MGQYLNARYQRKLHSLAEPLGFEVIDPLPVMSEQRAKDDLFIPYDRNHPSARGHALIAEAIARHLGEGDRLAGTAHAPAR